MGRNQTTAICWCFGVICLTAGCSDALDWKKAEETNSQAGYLAYVAAHPRGRFAEEARWRTATIDDTLLAYRGFLKSAPTPLGPRVAEAKSRFEARATSLLAGYDQSQEELEAILELQPNNAYALANLGCLWATRVSDKEFRTSRSLLERALEQAHNETIADGPARCIVAGVEDGGAELLCMARRGSGMRLLSGLVSDNLRTVKKRLAAVEHK